MASYNAADYIDKTTILNACDKIEDYAKDYYNMGKEMEIAADSFNKDTLSIEGESLDQLINDQATTIRDFERQIDEVVDGIRASVTQAYENKQAELNTQKIADEKAKSNSSASNN